MQNVIHQTQQLASQEYDEFIEFMGDNLENYGIDFIKENLITDAGEFGWIINYSYIRYCFQQMGGAKDLDPFLDEWLAK